MAIATRAMAQTECATPTIAPRIARLLLALPSSPLPSRSRFTTRPSTVSSSPRVSSNLWRSPSPWRRPSPRRRSARLTETPRPDAVPLSTTSAAPLATRASSREWHAPAARRNVPPKHKAKQLGEEGRRVQLARLRATTRQRARRSKSASQKRRRRRHGGRHGKAERTVELAPAPERKVTHRRKRSSTTLVLRCQEEYGSGNVRSPIIVIFWGIDRRCPPAPAKAGARGAIMYKLLHI
mmetsp:Transcript_38719/g.102121  ORF Transcript_38719/g.102121 Transcript_38719/m.102121 type:complete len:238 (+) Transcript_38719:231-944(+)